MILRLLGAVCLVAAASVIDVLEHDGDVNERVLRMDPVEAVRDLDSRGYNASDVVQAAQMALSFQ